mgnify:CR=1 FL=1
MSAQRYDRIRYDGTEYNLAATPLEQYFALHPERRPAFRGFDTGCMRGYVAEWAVRECRLYLVGMRMVMLTDATFESLFPDAVADGLFAGWVSGDLKGPHGELVQSVHAGFGSVWERELCLSFEDGVLKGAEDKRNA